MDEVKLDELFDEPLVDGENMLDLVLVKPETAPEQDTYQHEQQ